MELLQYMTTKPVIVERLPNSHSLVSSCLRDETRNGVISFVCIVKNAISAS